MTTENLKFKIGDEVYINNPEYKGIVYRVICIPGEWDAYYLSTCIEGKTTIEKKNSSEIRLVSFDRKSNPYSSDD